MAARLAWMGIGLKASEDEEFAARVREKYGGAADYVLKYITGHRHRVVRARVCVRVRVRARASSRRPRRLR